MLVHFWPELTLDFPKKKLRIWQSEVTLGGLPGAEKLSVQCGSEWQEWRSFCSGPGMSVVDPTKVSWSNIWHQYLDLFWLSFLAACPEKPLMIAKLSGIIFVTP